MTAAVWLWALIACFVPSTTHVEVCVTPTTDTRAAAVSTRWLGEFQTIPLLLQEEGLFCGTLTGPPVRTLRLNVTAQTETGGIKLEVITPVYSGSQRLWFALSDQGGGGLVQLGQRGSIGEVRQAQSTVVFATGAWLIGAVLVIHALVARNPTRVLPEWPRWANLAFWLFFAVVFTWPAAVAGPTQLVGRNLDALNTTWAISAAWRLLRGGLHDPLTGWPTGMDYPNFDSYTLLIIGAVGGWVGAVPLQAWLQVLGVAITGWASAWSARRLGADGPYPTLAGVLVAGSGLSATVLLEGHVYHLLAPFLPLALATWWVALGPEGRRRDGAITGVLFALCAFTTGYFGVAAGLAIGIMTLATLLFGPRPRWTVLGAALAVAGPISVAYVGWFIGQRPEGGGNSSSALTYGSAHLLSLVTATPEVDRMGHAMTFALSPVLLALWVLAPFTLGESTRWRPLYVTAGVAFVLSLGPSLVADPGHVLLDWPWGGLLSDVFYSFFRFPLRMGWVFLVAGSVTASLVATAIAPRLGRWGYLLLAFALLDSFFRVGMPARQAALPVGHSTALNTGEGAVFSLVPAVVGAHDEGTREWLASLACLDQAQHGRAIAQDCIGTLADEASAQSASLVGSLLAGQGLGEGFGALDYAAISIEPDLFREGDRARLTAALRRVDAQPRASADGGRFVEVYQLDAQQVPEPASALREHTGESTTAQISVMGAPKGLKLEGQLGDQPLSLRPRQGRAGAPVESVNEMLVEAPVGTPLSLRLVGTPDDGAPEVRWENPVVLVVDDTLTFAWLNDQLVATAPAPLPPIPAQTQATWPATGWVLGGLAVATAFGVIRFVQTTETPRRRRRRNAAR